MIKSSLNALALGHNGYRFDFLLLVSEINCTI